MRVAIVDDSVLLREGLVRLLTDAGLDVVLAGEDTHELLDLVRTAPPDVAIIDIRLPPTHTDEGIRAALEIRRLERGVGVLVLSQYVEPALATQLLTQSIDGIGYLLKDRVSDVPEFLSAVRRVARGGSALDPTLITALLQRTRTVDMLASLTRREGQVLELMASGHSNQGIADNLVITVRAVEKYVSSVFDKLGLPTTSNQSRRVLAVLLFLRRAAGIEA
jgi:DNA-binding NarL/FixJ family response regulator